MLPFPTIMQKANPPGALQPLLSAYTYAVGLVVLSVYRVEKRELIGHPANDETHQYHKQHAQYLPKTKVSKKRDENR